MPRVCISTLHHSAQHPLSSHLCVNFITQLLVYILCVFVLVFVCLLGVFSNSVSQVGWLKERQNVSYECHLSFFRLPGWVHISVLMPGVCFLCLPFYLLPWLRRLGFRRAGQRGQIIMECVVKCRTPRARMTKQSWAAQLPPMARPGEALRSGFATFGGWLGECGQWWIADDTLLSWP